VLQQELGIEDTSFIQFGYWDSLKKGLLSGEKLQYDLRRLENIYLEQNKREFEITKHISMALINPVSLSLLKETGACTITLPEELFDLDFPRHYFRRIKSVSISIPCIAGPYTSVNATLRLIKNEYRISKAEITANNYKKTAEEVITPGSGRFRSGANAISAIGTSSAQMDSGMFELNFRDERYLPFEGAGAASTWGLELMSDASLRQFDYETISDVIVHLKYSAREGEPQGAIENLRSVIADAATSGMPLSIAFDVKHEFADEWHKFFSVAAVDGSHVLNIQITRELFPYFANNHSIQLSTEYIFVKLKDDSVPPFSLTLPTGLELGHSPIENITFGKLYTGSLPLSQTLSSQEDFFYSKHSAGRF
jgi:hypothetical protein